MSKRKIFNFVCCLFISLLTITNVQALTEGPSQPEYYSFEPFDAENMVNLKTGDLSYVIPIGDVKAPNGVSYPFTLSYHAGIKNEQEATWVGLGWTLNVGSINRMIQGFPDDFCGDHYINHKHSKGDKGWDFMTGPKSSDPFGLGGTSSTFGWRYSSSSGDLQFLGYMGSSVDFGLFSLEHSAPNRTTGSSSSVGFSLHLLNIPSSIGGGKSASFSISYGGESNPEWSTSLSLSAGSVGLSLSSSGGTSVSASGSMGDVSFGVSVSLPSKSVSQGYNRSSWTIGGNFAVDAGWAGNYGGFFNATRWKWSFEQITAGKHYGYLYPTANNLFVVESDNDILNANIPDKPGYVYQPPLSGIPSEPPGDFEPDDIYIRETADKLEYMDVNDYSFGSQDIYNIAGQGIGGSFAPFKNKSLVTMHSHDNDRSGSMGGFNDKYYQDDLDFYFNGTENDETILSSRFKESDAIVFRMLGEAGMNMIDNLESDYSYNVSELDYGYDEFSCIDQTEGRISGTRIEPLIGFDPDLPKKLSGFIVTDPSGKTYYYTEPLYSLMNSSYTSETKNIDCNDKIKDHNLTFSENFGGYATTWLLTAVTGPDYVKKSFSPPEGVMHSSLERLMPHDGDWGFWVRFRYEYGDPVVEKDGLPVVQRPEEVSEDVVEDGAIKKGTYSWRDPYYDSQTEKRFHYENECYEHTNNPMKQEKYYSSFGRKEITYLKSIETSSEVAFFRTSERLDGFGIKYPDDFPKLGETFPIYPYGSGSENEIETEIKRKYCPPFIGTPFNHKMVLSFPSLVPLPERDGVYSNEELDLNKCHKIRIENTSGDHAYDESWFELFDEGSELVKLNFKARKLFNRISPSAIPFLRRTLRKSNKHGSITVIKDTECWEKIPGEMKLAKKSGVEKENALGSTLDNVEWGYFRFDLPLTDIDIPLPSSYTEKAKCVYAEMDGNDLVLYVLGYEGKLKDPWGDGQVRRSLRTGCSFGSDYQRTYRGALYSLKNVLGVKFRGGYVIDNAYRRFDSKNPSVTYCKKLDEIAWYSKTRYPGVTGASDPHLNSDKYDLKHIVDQYDYPQSYRRLKFRYNYELAKNTPNSLSDGLKECDIYRYLSESFFPTDAVLDGFELVGGGVGISEAVGYVSKDEKAYITFKDVVFPEDKTYSFKIYEGFSNTGYFNLEIDGVDIQLSKEHNRFKASDIYIGKGRHDVIISAYYPHSDVIKEKASFRKLTIEGIDKKFKRTVDVHTGGRLTLKEVREEAGPETNPVSMPPYLFTYQGKDKKYDFGNDYTDEWGMPINKDEDLKESNAGVYWNLSEVMLPSCAKVKFDYKRDYLYSVYGNLAWMKRNQRCVYDYDKSYYSEPQGEAYYDRHDVVSYSKSSADVLTLDDATALSEGQYCIVNVDDGEKGRTLYTYRIEEIDGNTVTLNKPVNLRPIPYPGDSKPDLELLALIDRYLPFGNIRVTSITSENSLGKEYKTSYNYTKGAVIRNLPSRSLPDLFVTEPPLSEAEDVKKWNCEECWIETRRGASIDGFSGDGYATLLKDNQNKLVLNAEPVTETGKYDVLIRYNCSYDDDEAVKRQIHVNLKLCGEDKDDCGPYIDLDNSFYTTFPETGPNEWDTLFLRKEIKEKTRIIDHFDEGEERYFKVVIEDESGSKGVLNIDWIQVRKSNRGNIIASKPFDIGIYDKNIFSSQDMIYPEVEVVQSGNGNSSDDQTKMLYKHYTYNDKIKVNDRSLPIIEKKEYENPSSYNVVQIIDRSGINGKLKSHEYYNNQGDLVRKVTPKYGFSEFLAEDHNVLYEGIDDASLLSDDKPLGMKRERVIRMQEKRTSQYNDEAGEDDLGHIKVDYYVAGISDYIISTPFMVGSIDWQDGVETETKFDIFDASRGTPMVTLTRNVDEDGNEKNMLEADIPEHLLASSGKQEVLKKKNIYTHSNTTFASETDRFVIPSSIQAVLDAHNTGSNDKEIFTSKGIGWTTEAFSTEYDKDGDGGDDPVTIDQYRIYKDSSFKWMGGAPFVFPDIESQQWRMTSQINGMDMYSRMKTIQNADGVSYTLIHHPVLPVITAKVDNAENDETAVFTCDYTTCVDWDKEDEVSCTFYDNLNAWEKGTSSLSSLRKHFGERSVHLSMSENVNTGPSKKLYGLHTNRNYVFSVWVYPVSVDASNPVSLCIDMYENGAYTPIKNEEANFTDLNPNTWNFISRRVSEEDISVADDAEHIRISVSSKSEGTYANGDFYIDDIRFYPEDAIIKTYYYDSNLGKPVTFVDENNVGRYYDYDQFGRLKEKGIIEDG